MFCAIELSKSEFWDLGVISNFLSYILKVPRYILALCTVCACSLREDQTFIIFFFLHLLERKYDFCDVTKGTADFSKLVTTPTYTCWLRPLRHPYLCPLPNVRKIWQIFRLGGKLEPQVTHGQKHADFRVRLESRSETPRSERGCNVGPFWRAVLCVSTHIAVCGSVNNVENKSFLFLSTSPMRTDGVYLLPRCSYWSPARSSSRPSCVWARRTTVAPSSWNTSSPSRHVDHRPPFPAPPCPPLWTHVFTISCCAATRPQTQRPQRRNFTICRRVFV